MKNFYKQEGYIALTSVIIISAILLILSAVISRAAFYTRFNVYDYESKKISTALAEACAQTAMVNLAKSPTTYPGSVPASGLLTTVDGNKTCRICSVSASSPYTIKTRAVTNSAYTNIVIVGTLSSSNFVVTSWDENITGPAGCNLP